MKIGKIYGRRHLQINPTFQTTQEAMKGKRVATVTAIRRPAAALSATLGTGSVVASESLSNRSRVRSNGARPAFIGES
jgi:hypothetical protein